jgi:hypothetical protein
VHLLTAVDEVGPPLPAAERRLQRRRRCGTVALVPAADPDLPLRQAAVGRVRELAETYDDLVPLARLREGSLFEGQRVSRRSSVAVCASSTTSRRSADTAHRPNRLHLYAP